MSKTARSGAQDRRLKEKRARKAAMQARYEGFRTQGANSKSKRFIKGLKRLAKTEKHSLSTCGNPGCIQCYGLSFKAFLRKGVPWRMPQWMFLEWQNRISKVASGKSHV